MWVWIIAAVAATAFACRDVDANISTCQTSIHQRDTNASSCWAEFARTPTAIRGGRLARALANTGGEIDLVRAIAELIGDRNGGAEAWDAVGEIESDGQRAIDAYTRALAHRDLDDLSGRAHDAVGLLHRYAMRDELRPAMGYAGLAYNLSTRLGDRQLSAYVLASVASLLFDMGALPTVEALVREEDGVVDEASPFYPNLCQLHGLIDLAHGRLGLARQELTHATRLASERSLSQLARNARLSIVDIDLASGDLDDATRVYASDRIGDRDSDDDRTHHAYLGARLALARGDIEGALSVISDVEPRASADWTGTLEALRGKAFAVSKRPREAERALVLAVESLERRRSELDLDEMKPWLLQKEWRWPLQDLFELYAEQGRWLDAFDVSQRATARSMLDGLLTHESDEPAALEIELGRAGDRAEGLRALTQSLRSSTAARPPPPGEILNELRERHVLTFFGGRTDVWLISTGGGLVIERLGSTTKLVSLAQRFIENPADRELATELGRRLLPTKQLPPRDTTIYIVADGDLGEIPFAALLVDGELLVNRNAIAYEPSAAVLAHIIRSPVPAGPRIVIGDPTGDLPDARREAIEVAQQVGTSARVGKAASVASLFETRSLDLLHVAAHAKQTSRGAALVLADREISAGDIIDGGMAVATVVLTSCESANAAQAAELGSLALAFIAAGAHAVVASRWSVDDAVARRFSQTFYANGGARDPIGATAAAQRELIRAGDSVRSWATYVVFGDAKAR